MKTLSISNTEDTQIKSGKFEITINPGRLDADGKVCTMIIIHADKEQCHVKVAGQIVDTAAISIIQRA